MHGRGMAMQPAYVGKMEDLYLWCLIRDLGVLMADAFFVLMQHWLWIRETRQTLMLEKIGVHDQHSHSVCKVNACKSAPSVGVVHFLFSLRQLGFGE